MNAILYIGHGSRVKEAMRQAMSFIQKLMKKMDAPIQEIGFLELSEPTIEQSFERCIQQGATTITVIPILLLTAHHAKKDIPHVLALLKKRYPNVTINYGHPIGVHDNMIELLKERILDTNVSLNGDYSVLIVGRGSSDSDAVRDLTKIGDMLKRSLCINHVKVCFLTAAGPTFQQGLEWAKRTGSEKVFVLPYLLFSGTLRKKIEKVLIEIGREQSSEFFLCRHLGYHPIIEDIFCDQINQLQR